MVRCLMAAALYQAPMSLEVACMHWLWRVVLTICGAIALGHGVFEAIDYIVGGFVHYAQFNGLPAAADRLSMWMSYMHYVGPAPFVLILVPPIYLLLRRITADQREEVGCRKCGYILRGLSQPKCPECGEQV